jgi:hypothetical protein
VRGSLLPCERTSRHRDPASDTLRKVGGQYSLDAWDKHVRKAMHLARKMANSKYVNDNNNIYPGRKDYMSGSQGLYKWVVESI